MLLSLWDQVSPNPQLCFSCGYTERIAPQPHLVKPRCKFGQKLAPKMEKGCTRATHYDCVKRKINKDCLLTIGDTCEIELESICKANGMDSLPPRRSLY